MDSKLSPRACRVRLHEKCVDKAFNCTHSLHVCVFGSSHRIRLSLIKSNYLGHFLAIKSNNAMGDSCLDCVWGGWVGGGR